MEQELIDKINDQVFTQFPYLKGISPSIKQNPDNSISLKYSGESKTESDFTILISVKVKVADNGDIIQITSSR
ncbi:MAG: hypothetical protein Q7J07_01400 [Pelolinea sp.]|nr:hypothetical protein [Pelolinea sp.]